MKTQPYQDASPPDQAWQQIERLMEEAAGLTTSSVDTAEFYCRLLDLTVQAMAAVGGAIWRRDGEGRFFLEHQIQLEATELVEGEFARTRHAGLLAAVVQEAGSQAVAPQSGPAGNSEGENPSDLLLLLCPLMSEGQSVGVIEIFQRPDVDPAAREGYLRLLTLVADFVADFQRNRELRNLREHESSWRQSDQFARNVHRSLDLRTTAFAIANQGRSLIGCDRVSVLVHRSGQCQLLSISGVDTVERRSNAVRHLERLASIVVRTDETLWYCGEPLPLAPEMDSVLQQYIDEQHVRTLVVVPLDRGEKSINGADSPPLGALVVERYDAERPAHMPQTIEAVSAHGSAALRNAVEIQTLPLLYASRMLRSAGWFVRARQLPKTLAAFFALVALGLVLVFVPADFDVKARGELQPLNRRDLFAPMDGEVVELRAKHDAPIAAGDAAVLLRSSELDLEFQRVAGELETTSQRLQAVISTRVVNQGKELQDTLQRARLTAEEAELRQTVASQERQLEALRAQRTALTVRAPIEGRVLTWDLERSLTGRPVRRGQLLLSVAAVNGPWVAELKVPDRHTGHVLRARAKDPTQPLDVSFVLGSHPGVTYQGTVREVAAAVSTTDVENPGVQVKVDIIDGPAMPALRPGSTVVAKIHCGRRPLGYVWLHDLISAIQTWVLF